MGEECDEEWVGSRLKTRQRSVRCTIGLDGTTAVGIKCGAVLEIEKRDDVVLVDFGGKFLSKVRSNDNEWQRGN